MTKKLTPADLKAKRQAAAAKGRETKARKAAEKAKAEAESKLWPVPRVEETSYLEPKAKPASPPTKPTGPKIIKRFTHHAGIIPGCPFESESFDGVEFLITHKIFKNRNDPQEDGQLLYGKKIMLSEAHYLKVKTKIADYRVRWVGDMPPDENGDLVGVGPNKKSSYGMWFTTKSGEGFYGLEHTDEPLAKYLYLKRGRVDFINPPSTSMYDEDPEFFKLKGPQQVIYQDDDGEGDVVGPVDSDSIPAEYPPVHI